MNRKQYIKSLLWLDDALTALTNPSELWLAIQEKASFRYYALFFPVATAVTLIISISLLQTQTRFFFSKISYGWIFLTLSLLLIIIVHAMTLDGILQFFGHGGHFRQILQISLFSQLPFLLVLPGTMIFNTIGFASGFFWALLVFFAFIWGGYMEVAAVIQCSGRSIEHSFLFWLGSWAVWIVACVFTVLALFLMLISAI